MLFTALFFSSVSHIFMYFIKIFAVVCIFVHSALFTFQVRALCETLVVHDQMKTSWLFRLCGILSIGHALHPGVQRVQSWPFKDLTYHGSNKRNFVFFRPPTIKPGCFKLHLTSYGMAKSFSCSLSQLRLSAHR